MNDLLGYVLESFFDSRQARLNMLSTPEVLKSKDVVEYIRSNMKGSKTKPGAFLREGALYFLNSMVKEGGALERGKPGTAAPGYAFEGGKKEYGKIRGDAPLRRVQRPLIVPDVDYPGVSREKLEDVMIHEGLAMFRRWANRNKPRFFAYTPTNPVTDSELEDNTTELMDLYSRHTDRFRRIHDLVLEHNNASEIHFSPAKGKLPPGTKGVRTGITINRPPQAQWLCLKIRAKEGATWTMYSSSIGKLGVLFGRNGMQPMVSSYGTHWDIWLLLPDVMTLPDAYDLIGSLSGIVRVGRATKGVAYRSFLMDSAIISEKTFTDDTAIFPLSLHIHHGKEKVATMQKGMGNQDFRIDTGLSMIPSSGMLTLFDQGIENHPLQAMFNAPDLLARVYRFARSAEIIPQLHSSTSLLEIDNDVSNMGRDAWVGMKEHTDDTYAPGELRVAPKGRDVTMTYDGTKAYMVGLPGDRKVTGIPHTDEFEQLCTTPTIAYGKIQGSDSDALVAMLSMLDIEDYDTKKVTQAFSNRIILLWSSDHYVNLRLDALSGRYIRSVKRAAPDDLNEMMEVAPHGLITGLDDSPDELIPAVESTPVLVLGYEKDSVQNNEARVIIVGKMVSNTVDVLGVGKNKPLIKVGSQVRDEYQEIARVGTFTGFTYDDRRSLYEYISNLDYSGEHEGDILIDPLEAGIIFEMQFRGLLKDKPMWKYNRKGNHRDWQEKQKLPGRGERDVVGVKSTYSLDAMSKESMPQYNNPKIVGYRVAMGREEQRLQPFLIASSDVTYGVGIKNNPPLEISKYTNYIEKENSPFLAVLGLTSENNAADDFKVFKEKMEAKFGEDIQVIHSQRTLTALKKGTKLGEICGNCGGPKAFSPPGVTKQERAADEGPSVYFWCSICGRQERQRDRKNPPVLVATSEYKEQLKIAQKLIGYEADDELSEESGPYLHTEWPRWFRRTQRDLIVRGLEKLDYTGVVKGIANRTGSPYYQNLLGIARRNSGKGLIKNRKQHQELAMLYTLCHDDVDFILAWPNATTSGEMEAFESELEQTSTLIYQKEIALTKKAATVLSMQMYAGEDFVSKKQSVQKTLASGWLQEDDDEERKVRIYLIHSNSEKTLRGKAAPRKEELRSIFKTSRDDKKSYIHTADNSVQVTEYAQVLLNENSLILLQHNDIDLLLTRKESKEWLMINSMKKYMQQEFGSLFFLCSTIKSGSGAYLHGIRKTQDVDLMIDDRRLGPDTKVKAIRMRELLPWMDYSLAYSGRNDPKFWDYETFVPGKTFYDKRCEMTHNPKYHAYFLGMKVESPEGYLYQRMMRVSNDSRPRATADLLMLLEMMKQGRFRFLDKKIQIPWKRSKVEGVIYRDLGGWLQTAKYWMLVRYGVKMEKKDIWELLKVGIKKNKPRRNRDLDATEERLLSDIDGRFNDFSETRNNPSEHRIILTVPHALPAGDDVEDHWCDWSAAPAAQQLFGILKEKHDTHLQMADKKRSEIDYNRAVSAETRWQLELDGLLEKADMLVDVHSFPVDDPMWAGYDFVLFSCDRWPMEAQNDQAQLMEHLRSKGYKVMMDIADHRNYIQEKGVSIGIPSFLIEFGEHLKLKKPCEDLAKCLDVFCHKEQHPVEMLLRDNPIRGTSAKHFDRSMREGYFKPRRGGGVYAGYTAVWAAAGETKEHAETVFEYAASGGGGFETQLDRVPVVHYIPESDDMVIQRAWGTEGYDAVRFPNGFKAENTEEVWRGESFYDWESQRTGFFQRLRDSLDTVSHGENPNAYMRYKRAQRKSFDKALKEFRLTQPLDTPGSMSYANSFAVLKENPVLPLKRHGWSAEPAYQTYDGNEEENHKETKKFGKKHDKYVKELMRKKYPKWNWTQPLLEGKEGERESKFLGKARKKADKEIGPFTICPNNCLYCYNEQAKSNPPKGYYHVTQMLDKIKETGFYRKSHGATPLEKDGVHARGDWQTSVTHARRDSRKSKGRLRTEVGIVVIPFDIAAKYQVHKTPRYDDAVIIEIPEGESIPPEDLIFVPMEQIPIRNPPAEGITWKTSRFKFPIPEMEGSKMAKPVLSNVFQLDGTDEEGNTVSIKTNQYDTETEYDFSNTAVSCQDWLRELGVHSYAYVMGADTSKKGIGLGQAAYLKMAELAPAVLSTNHSESAERAWSALEKHTPKYGYTIHKKKITYPMSKAKGDGWDGEGFRYNRVLIKNETRENPIGFGLPILITSIIKGMSEGELAIGEMAMQNPPVFPRPERVVGKKGGKYMTGSGKDVTGRHFKNANIIGSTRAINIEWENEEDEPEPKPAPKSGMRRIRFNMLRPDKYEVVKPYGSFKGGEWIVTAETSKGHTYALNADVKTTITLQTFPQKKSEPRLRPETYGAITKLKAVGKIKIKSSGKTHTLYAGLSIEDIKMNPNQSNVSIVERFVVTLDPAFKFTSATIAEMLKDRGYKRITSRSIGTILPKLVEREQLIITNYNPKVYRNKQVIE